MSRIINEAKDTVKKTFLFFGLLVSIAIIILVELNVPFLVILGWILEWVVLTVITIIIIVYIIEYTEKNKKLEDANYLYISISSAIITAVVIGILLLLNFSLSTILSWISIILFTVAGIVYICTATETRRNALIKYLLVAILVIIFIKNFFSLKVLITLLIATLLTIYNVFIIVVAAIIIAAVIILLLVIVILFSQATKKENKKAIEIRKLETENANRIKKQEEESEKIRRAEIEKKERMEKIEKAARIMAKPIKKFLIENQGELFDEVKLRSNLVHTSSEDEIFYHALQSLSYEEGFRTHIEHLGGYISKTYYYYVIPENEES